MLALQRFLRQRPIIVSNREIPTSGRSAIFPNEATGWKPAWMLVLRGFCGHQRSNTPKKSKARLYAGFCAARCRAVAIIPLGRRSRAGSSHLPAASPSRIVGCLFGVAPRRDCPFHPASVRTPTRLCCSDPHLTVDRCYLLRRSTESGRSSRRRTCQRPPGGLCTADFSEIEDSSTLTPASLPLRGREERGVRRDGWRPARPGATAAVRRCG